MGLVGTSELIGLIIQSEALQNGITAVEAFEKYQNDKEFERKVLDRLHELLINIKQD